MARLPLLKRSREYINPIQELINGLLEDLFSHETKSLSDLLQKIVIENQSLGGTMNVFLFESLHYSHLPPHLVKDVRGVRELHRDLHPKMQRYLLRLSKITRDKRFVTNAFSPLTQKCHSLQDMRDALPEVLISRVPTFSNLDRMRDEGWVIEDNPLLFKQFQEAVDIVLTYQANRLIS
jgi:hypothetical protein